jgi:hypothetical protein
MVNRSSHSLPPKFARARAIDARDALVAMLAALAAVAMMALAAEARAATYKWVDDKGVVHYTDKIPTEAVNKGSTVLDKQARPVKKIEPALTPEQIRAREAEEEQRRLASRANEEVARRDRALVSSYTTEAEIELARSRALGTIDAQLESSQAYTVQLVKRRDELAKRKAALGDKPMPAALEREIEGTASELEKTAALIEQKRKERVGVVSRYDADRTRWRELKAIADANAAAVQATPRSHPAAVSTSAPKK